LIIALEHGRWIGDIAVTIGDLPAQPILEFCRSRDIDLRTVVVTAAEIRIKGKSLPDIRCLATAFTWN
jgi:hypothetical protein